MTIHLAGVPLRDELVLELARLVDDDELSSRLETAYGRMTKVLALTIAERETIIRGSTMLHRGSRSSAPCCYVNTSREPGERWLNPAPRALLKSARRHGICSCNNPVAE